PEVSGVSEVPGCDTGRGCGCGGSAGSWQYPPLRPAPAKAKDLRVGNRMGGVRGHTWVLQLRVQTWAVSSGEVGCGGECPRGDGVVQGSRRKKGTVKVGQNAKNRKHGNRKYTGFEQESGK